MMTGVVTRRRLSPRLNTEDTVAPATTTPRRTRSSKKVSTKESKNVTKKSAVAKRRSRRSNDESEKLPSTKDTSNSTKENKSKPTKSTKKFFKFINPKSEKEDMYMKNISSIIQHGLKKAKRKPTGKPKTRPKQKEISKVNDSSSFQLPIKESSLRQVTSRNLRPRRKVMQKSIESELITKYLTPRERKSIVLLPKLNDESIQKNPVYKRFKIQDDSIRNESDIYDFKFDDNDTREKLMKKKKRRIAKKPATKRVRKNKNVKHIPQEELATDNAKPAINDDKAIVKDINTETTVKLNSELAVNPDFNDNAAEDTEKIIEMHNDDVQESLENTFEKPDKSITNKKPTIIATENLSNKIVKIVVPSNVKNDKPKTYHPVVAANRKSTLYRNMMEDTLLNKSMSPILKATVNFDPSSPWRAPIVHTFSQVKNLFQSTPRANKLNTALYNTEASKKSQKIEQNMKTNSTSKNSDENSGILIEQNSSKKSSAPLSARKFGTEITNVGASNKNNTSQVSKTSTLPTVKSNSSTSIAIIAGSSKSAEPMTPNAQIVGFMQSTPATNLSSFNDVFEDKENTVPNFQTPKKKSPKKKVTVLSPMRPRHMSSQSFNKENTIDDPQPGPSGLQMLKVRDEEKVLRQSNLNNFLNIPEMPESTRISTKHGIFDDAQSTPVSSKSAKKMQKIEPNIENAFGFSDNDESDLEISSIQSEAAMKPVKKLDVHNQENIKSSIPVPARLPTAPIRRNILPKLQRPASQKQPKLTVENVRKKEDLTEPKKIPIDVVSFSDTFDMMSEADELSKDLTNPPLFADLEPSHFAQPPRHSYKRKRNVRFSFSEGESENEEAENDEDHQVQEHKKRKVGKMKKQEEKRLEEWVKNVNETFEEIDHYDLVVE